MNNQKQSMVAQVTNEMNKLFDQSTLKLSFPNKSAFTSRSWKIFLLLVGLFIGFRIWHLTGFSLWTDELFSLVTVRLPWGAMFERLVLDKVHPPLFYVLLKLWITMGGQSLLWLKLFPFLTSIAALVPFYFLCRELNLTAFSTNLTLMLMAVNGYLVFYAQEVRMYSLLSFFTVSSFWLFICFINHDTVLKKNLFMLFLGNLFLVYTHCFGWLVVGVEGIFLLWLNRQKFRLFLISAAALVFCFSPWVSLVVNAILTNQGPMGGLDWIERPGCLRFSNILQF